MANKDYEWLHDVDGRTGTISMEADGKVRAPWGTGAWKEIGPDSMWMKFEYDPSEYPAGPTEHTFRF